MKINEQYHDLNLLENVTYEFLGRDGETHEETEPILVEHMMDWFWGVFLLKESSLLLMTLTRSTSVNSANVPALS